MGVDFHEWLQRYKSILVVFAAPDDADLLGHRILRDPSVSARRVIVRIAPEA